MRITMRIDGGLAYLPGRAKPRTLDVDALPSPEQDRIRGLLDAARGSATRRGAASQAADARTYTIEVDDGRRRSELRFTEPFADEHCARLVQALREHLP